MNVPNRFTRVQGAAGAAVLRVSCVCRWWIVRPCVDIKFKLALGYFRALVVAGGGGMGIIWFAGGWSCGRKCGDGHAARWGNTVKFRESM